MVLYTCLHRLAVTYDTYIGSHTTLYNILPEVRSAETFVYCLNETSELAAHDRLVDAKRVDHVLPVVESDLSKSNQVETI